MMAKWIRKSLKSQVMKILDLKKKLFQYKPATKKTIAEDGPLMPKIIYNRINPPTCIDVCNLISSLFQFNLKNYNQNVPKMADAFEATYNLILENEDKMVKPKWSFFDALLTSTNHNFKTGIKHELSKWESGAKMNLEKIKDNDIKNYNNISEKKNKKHGKTFPKQLFLQILLLDLQFPTSKPT